MIDIKVALLRDWEHEVAGTERLLKLIPEEHLSWKPHQKSMSLGELATHISRLPSWVRSLARDFFYDAAHQMPAVKSSKQESLATLLSRFTENCDYFVEVVEDLSLDQLSETWEYRRGADTLTALPRSSAIRIFAIHHLVHHRAQLGIYLRLLGLPLPALYGTTADELPSR